MDGIFHVIDLEDKVTELKSLNLAGEFVAINHDYHVILTLAEEGTSSSTNTSTATRFSTRAAGHAGMLEPS